MKKMLSFILAIISAVLIAAPQMDDSFVPESGRFWILFSDKPEMTDDFSIEFESSLSEHKIQRRNRTRAQNDLVTVYDIPINTEYIAKVEDAGFEVYRQSKWLNAVSVKADSYLSVKSLLDLECVIGLKPVVTYKRPLDKTDISSKAAEESFHVLEYGISEAQLRMLGMVDVHRMGFNGEGVILSVFDTGFRTTHQAFRDLNILAEYDFVESDSLTSTPESATSHGTKTWSAAAGSFSGELYGPGYGATIILARTEDSSGEYETEEDNWAAAIEWAESLGTDVVTSSLGYDDWYTPEDMNGDSCITTRAADIAASLGVLVVNAAGNSGFGRTTLAAPGDADSIITVGAVSIDSSLASFSSRGPTSDGRTKPDICALGMGTRCARNGSDFDFGTGTGTSLSTPLIGGACAAVLQAYPDWSPMDVLEKLKANANNKVLPDNDFGWGIPNFSAALRTSGDSLAMIPLFAGWNMVSNPLADTLILGADIFPDLYSSCWWYNPLESVYQEVTRLAPGQTCFLPYAKDTIIYLNEALTDSIFSPVHPGWNMVGASGKASFPGEYNIIPDTAPVDGEFYFYDPIDKEYISKKVLISGEARWVLVSEHASFFAR